MIFFANALVGFTSFCGDKFPEHSESVMQILHVSFIRGRNYKEKCTGRYSLFKLQYAIGVNQILPQKCGDSVTEVLLFVNC